MPVRGATRAPVGSGISSLVPPPVTRLSWAPAALMSEPVEPQTTLHPAPLDQAPPQSSSSAAWVHGYSPGSTTPSGGERDQGSIGVTAGLPWRTPLRRRYRWPRIPRAGSVPGADVTLWIADLQTVRAPGRSLADMGWLLLYVPLSLAFTWPLVSRFTTAITGERDVWQNLWNIVWLRRAITTGQNPFFTHDLWHPDGATLVFQTFDLPDSLLGATVIPLFGLWPTYNLIVLWTFIGSAAAMYVLGRGTGASRPAAFLSGCAYSFCTYHFAHALAHLHLLSMEWVPLYVLALWKILETGSWRWTICAGVLLALASLSSWYYLLAFVRSGAVPDKPGGIRGTLFALSLSLSDSARLSLPRARSRRMPARQTSMLPRLCLPEWPRRTLRLLRLRRSPLHGHKHRLGSAATVASVRRHRPAGSMSPESSSPQKS